MSLTRCKVVSSSFSRHSIISVLTIFGAALTEGLTVAGFGSVWAADLAIAGVAAGLAARMAEAESAFEDDAGGTRKTTGPSDLPAASFATDAEEILGADAGLAEASAAGAVKGAGSVVLPFLTSLLLARANFDAL